MEASRDRSGLALLGAVIAWLAASLCCILPVVTVLLGKTGFAAAEVFGRWRPYLLAATFTLLGLGFYLAYRPRQAACESGSVCNRSSLACWSRTLLWLAAALVVAFAAFPYYGAWLLKAIGSERHVELGGPGTALTHVVLRIDGMDCPVCAGGLQNNLRQIPGVGRAEVSFQDKQVGIDYDSRAVNLSRFEQAVRDSGFKVAGILAANR